MMGQYVRDPRTGQLVWQEGTPTPGGPPGGFVPASSTPAAPATPYINQVLGGVPTPTPMPGQVGADPTVASLNPNADFFQQLMAMLARLNPLQGIGGLQQQALSQQLNGPIGPNMREAAAKLGTLFEPLVNPSTYMGPIGAVRFGAQPGANTADLNGGPLNGIERYLSSGAPDAAGQVAAVAPMPPSLGNAPLTSLGSMGPGIGEEPGAPSSPPTGRPAGRDDWAQPAASVGLPGLPGATGAATPTGRPAGGDNWAQPASAGGGLGSTSGLPASAAGGWSTVQNQMLRENPVRAMWELLGPAGNRNNWMANKTVDFYGAAMPMLNQLSALASGGTGAYNDLDSQDFGRFAQDFIASLQRPGGTGRTPAQWGTQFMDRVAAGEFSADQLAALGMTPEKMVDLLQYTNLASGAAPQMAKARAARMSEEMDRQWGNQLRGGLAADDVVAQAQALRRMMGR